MTHRPADFAAARRIVCIGSGLLMSILVAFSISGADAQESGVDDNAAQHTHAVEIGRESHYDEALESLQQPRSDDPDNKRLLHDQIVNLSWATRDHDVIDIGLPIGVDSAPAYVQ